VGGVQVQLHRENSLRRDGFADYETVTSGEGVFTFERIEPGSYRLIGDGEGFVQSEYGAKGAFQRGITVRLLPGHTIANLEFRLIPTGVISGRVTDEKGKPMPNVEVNVLRPFYGTGRRMLAPAGMDRTDDLGEYRAFRLPPGRYYLAATLRPWLGGVNQLAPSGQKKEEYVTLFYPGIHDVRAAQPVYVAPGQEVSGMDFRLMKEPVVRVRGRVTKPADVGVVTLWLTPEWLAGMPGQTRTQASRDGQFVFPNVLGGRYSIIAAGLAGQGRVSGKQVIEAGNEDLDDVVVSVGRGVEVRGVVRSEGERSLPNAVERVILVPAETTGLVFAPVSPANVSKDGSFTLANVGTDRYAVELNPLPDGYYLKSVRAGDSDLLVEGIDGGASWLPAATLDILLSAKAARLEGVVRTEKGRPVAGATVVMIPESAEKRLYLRFCRTASADQDGFFAVSNVEPGEYTAYAWTGVETGIWMDPEFMKEYAGKGENLTISEGGKENVQLTLLEGR
jgi:hypothetical protein